MSLMSDQVTRVDVQMYIEHVFANTHRVSTIFLVLSWRNANVAATLVTELTKAFEKIQLIVV